MHYGQNEAYLTQQHIKISLNMKLVSHYAKSVGHENSRSLDFVSVQVKHIVQKGHFYLVPTE